MDVSENTAALLATMQADLHKQRVLIIDRHPPARESLRLMLANLGITQVHGAGSSADVLRQVRNNPFDIVLSDYILEDGRDGQQLLEELRHNHLLPLSAVYMIVTSERSYHNVVSLAELTPDDYLIKPFTADLLQTRLTKALYKKHVLKPIYTHMARGAFEQAIQACDLVIMENPAYQLEAQRFKGELLQTLGRLEEAQGLYQGLLTLKPIPWAKMGLAMVARTQNRLEEAEKLAQELIEENPDFLSAYDFLSLVRESQGHLVEAQEALQEAALRAPHNTLRLRLVGDLALQNNELEVAERAFSKVLERHRGSSLRSVDDYTSLSKVHLEKGNLNGAREVIKNLRRDWRGEKQGELAALVMESLSYQKEGDEAKAGQLVEQALKLHQELAAEQDSTVPGSRRLTVDLAQACMETGKDEAAHQLLRQVATEHHDDFRVISHIENVFEKTGQSDVGRAMLEEVGAEIIRLNNEGVLTARGGDLKAAVDMLMNAADRVPNVQFLVNAARAIFTLMDQQGWDVDLAARATDYLKRAQTKAPRNPKVLLTLEIHAQVARKYGISILDVEAGSNSQSP
ncbi:MAG: response regulator [Azovibrio sp.]|uniref:response regulator n=1 Tax=Azovibrio sp. TaxID=1872673 RepID=UPI003C771512